MKSAAVRKDLERIVEKVEHDVDLRNLSSIGISGKADSVVLPSNIEELRNVVKYCYERGIEYGRRGNGTNTIYGDLDVLIDVQKLNKPLKVSKKDKIIQVESGMLLGRDWWKPIQVRSASNLVKHYVKNNTLAGIAYKEELSGVELLADVPGTVGGATVMNAACKFQSMDQIVKEVGLIDERGEYRTLKKGDGKGYNWFFGNNNLNFEYRRSILQDKRYSKWLVYSVMFQLKNSKKRDIAKKMYSMHKQRERAHPKGKSAGSIFKLRGYGINYNTAVEIIDEANMRGYEKGDLLVSPKYPVFIINKGNASITQFNDLLIDIHKKVYDRTGHKLELELKYQPDNLAPRLE